MRVDYFREMKQHHLVITAEEVCLMDYQMEMIKNNELKGVICPVVRKSDERTEYDYLITGWQSLQTFVETVPLSENVLSALVQGLCTVMEEMDRYLLDGDYVCLRPEYIYLQKKGDCIVGVKYCLFPFQRKAIEQQIRDLFKYIINEVDYQEKAAVTLAYELFQAVQEQVLLSDLKELIQPAKNENSEIEVKPEVYREINPDVSMIDVIEKTDEILWKEEMVPGLIRRQQERKPIGGVEIALPEWKKGSIIKLLTQKRR